MLVAMPSTEPARGATGAPPDPPGHPLGAPWTPPAGTATAARLAAYRWGLALVGVTAVWGATFVMVRDAVAAIPPFTFIAYRFLAAAALLAAVRPRALARRDRGPGRPGRRAGLARPGRHRRARLGRRLPGPDARPARGLPHQDRGDPDHGAGLRRPVRLPAGWRAAGGTRLGRCMLHPCWHARGRAGPPAERPQPCRRRLRVRHP